MSTFYGIYLSGKFKTFLSDAGVPNAELLNYLYRVEESFPGWMNNKKVFVSENWFLEGN